NHAHEIGLASTLMAGLNNLLLTRIFCGYLQKAVAEAKELTALADQTGSSYWKACATLHQGDISALTGNFSDAVRMITLGIAAFRSTGSTIWLPMHLSYLAYSHAKLGQFDDAWRCTSDALDKIATTKETWFEAEVNRIAGKIALKSPEPDT